MLIKAFRLFVSSTFADFEAERGVLQAQVFPALYGYFSAKGYQFFPLDMRWGISDDRKAWWLRGERVTWRSSV